MSDWSETAAVEQSTITEEKTVNVLMPSVRLNVTNAERNYTISPGYFIRHSLHSDWHVLMSAVIKRCSIVLYTHILLIVLRGLTVR